MQHKSYYYFIALCSALAFVLLVGPFTSITSSQGKKVLFIQADYQLGLHWKEKAVAIEKAKRQVRIKLENRCYGICGSLSIKVFDISYSEITCEYDKQIPGYACSLHAEGYCRCEEN